MKTKPTPKAQPKPMPKAKRPRCVQCKKGLLPQFVTASLPRKLVDGRRKAEREAWEQAHPPVFTGNYGRYGDNCFCGVTCGYQWAVKTIGAPKSRK